MPSWVTATNELSGRGVTPKSDGQTPLGSQNGAVSGEIAPARTVAGYGARLTAAIGNRLTSDAFGTDVLLAVAGLAVTQVRIIQSHDGWPYAPNLFQFLVAVAPALIAIRRTDPVLASLGLAVGAYTSLLLGQTDWVLLVGCASALWPDLAQRDLQEVLAGFQRIGDAGRRALGELDRMLSALRDAEGRPDPALSPQPGLDDIAQLAKGLSEQGLPVKLEVRGSGAPVPDGVQVTAYRLVQEALTNVVKHARATKVQVLVDVSASGVGVQIIDDGQGFDSTRSADGRHGLTGMRERVRIHEGTFTLRSWPGTGTTVSAFLPYAEEQAIP